MEMVVFIWFGFLWQFPTIHRNAMLIAAAALELLGRPGTATDGQEREKEGLEGFGNG
jgi:hypothetical protein